MPGQYDSTGFPTGASPSPVTGSPSASSPARPDGLARIPARHLAGHRQPARPDLPHQRTGTGPVTPDYPGKHQLRGISLEHIRRDRILQEALAARADPLHLALIFNIDHTNAMAYASAARNLLSGPAGQALLPFARNEHEGAARGEHIEIEKAYRPLTTGSWGR